MVHAAHERPVVDRGPDVAPGEHQHQHRREKGAARNRRSHPGERFCQGGFLGRGLPERRHQVHDPRREHEQSRRGQQRHREHDPLSGHHLGARPRARANAGRSSIRTGVPGGLYPETSGSSGPLAGPNLRYARSPATKTSSAEETATASVTPVPKNRAGTSTTAGTSAIESATAYVSRSARSAEAHRHLAQNQPGTKPTRNAADSARIRSGSKPGPRVWVTDARRTA
jgi:hypothetical protein